MHSVMHIAQIDDDICRREFLRCIGWIQVLGSFCDTPWSDVLTTELAVFPAKDFIVYTFIELTSVNTIKDGARCGEFLRMETQELSDFSKLERG